MRDAIYFIAILPPEEIRKEINIFQNYASHYFESSHALKSPPHITIFPPFKWNDSDEGSLVSAVHEIANNRDKFYVQLNNFDTFAPKVIFINVEENSEVKRLHQDAISKMYMSFELENKSPHQYKPHVTVAFRDLKRNYFLKAWSHFAKTNYERAFQADRIALLKHEDQKWNIVEEFLLD